MHFFSNVAAAAVVVLASFACACLTSGCASAERPEAEDSVIPDGVNNAAPQSVDSQAAHCEVGSARMCSKTWVDIRGQKHCIPSTQYCAATGEGWLECGASAPAAPTGASALAPADATESDSLSQLTE